MKGLAQILGQHKDGHCPVWIATATEEREPRNSRKERKTAEIAWTAYSVEASLQRHSMTEIHISVRDVAAELGTRKQTVFKVMKRLGITGTKRRDVARRNQVVGYVTRNEFEQIRRTLDRSRVSGASEFAGHGCGDGFISNEIGVFYLVRLEPEHDPGRIKVGFAANLHERLRALRCSAPFAAVVETWPCKRLWEKTAIDSVTAGCEQLHTEVFRTPTIEEVADKCRRFFSLMPCLDRAGN